MRIILILIFCLILTSSIPASSENVYEDGKKLHTVMLRQYKSLEPLNYEPYIFGIGTEKPLCCIVVPIKAWNKSSNEQKELLKKYAQNRIAKVKSDPFKYAGNLSPMPSIASQFKANVEKMNDKSWCVMAGNVAKDGKSILLDKTVATGGE